MPAKANSRNWTDVQSAIATVAIVATLGMWNLFSSPSKTGPVETASEPNIPPTEPPAAPATAGTPQVKIMFTQMAPPTTDIQQVQNNQQQQKKKKKKDNDNSTNNSGGGSVTQTKTS